MKTAEIDRLCHEEWMQDLYGRVEFESRVTDWLNTMEDEVIQWGIRHNTARRLTDKLFLTDCGGKEAKLTAKELMELILNNVSHDLIWDSWFDCGVKVFRNGEEV